MLVEGPDFPLFIFVDGAVAELGEGELELPRLMSPVPVRPTIVKSEVYTVVGGFVRVEVNRM